jgi:hypothetical protein
LHVLAFKDDESVKSSLLNRNAIMKKKKDGRDGYAHAITLPAEAKAVCVGAYQFNNRFFPRKHCQIQ